MDTIQGMRTFAAVAAHRSFTEGARRVGISTKLASKYVAQLEERLNAQLFHRTTRSVTLTDTGRAYYERCLPLLEQFDELEGLVQQRQSELAGRIRLTSSTGFGTMHLPRLLRSFQKAHPKVIIDLHLTDHNVALVEEGFDLGLRIGELADSSLVARKLADMRIIVCGSPDYLEEHGTPAEPQALAAHNCLLLTLGSKPDQWAFRGTNGTISVQVNGSFRANSPPAVVRMAADGMGICRTPLYTVGSFIEKGTLVPILEAWEMEALGLYAVYPPGRHLTARIRAFIDHVAQHL